MAAKSIEKVSDYHPSPDALPPSWFRRTLWWGCYLIACGTVVSLGIVTVLRVFYHDGTFLLIWLNAFTRYIYLPAYACAAWAAWQRRWWLLAASLIVVACHGAWMAPDFIRDRRYVLPPNGIEAAPSSAPTFRIFFANVAASNDQRESLLHEIAAADPDIVLLAEFSWPWHIAFKASPIMAHYPFGTGWTPARIGSICWFSKVPLKTESAIGVSGRSVHTIELELGLQTLRLIGLHGPRPVGVPASDYHGYWDYLLPQLKREAGPLVIVGDFNATEHSRVYKDLTAGRLRSAHDDLGRGYATTWPNGRLWVPPIRIDQAFISPEIECVRIVEGEGAGSDHRPLVLDVQIREP